MEAIGLAIGVPGLADVFLRSALKGYDILADARDASADIDHYILSITLEQQKLRDWKDAIDHAKLSNDPESPERRRYLLIVETLGRIARLLTSVGAMEDVYVPPAKSLGVRKVSSKSSPSRFFHHFRRSRRMVGFSETEATTGSSSPHSHFNMEEILPDQVNIDQLKSLKETVEKSEISIQSIKWAFSDREKLQLLLERLTGYTERLIEISAPLMSASVVRPRTSAEHQLMIPLPRNPDYVERKDIESRLIELLAPRNDIQPRAALWGLGGMGKTTIAAHYCFRCYQDRSTSIFWVYSNSDETFEAGYREIATRVGIKALDGDQSALQDAVKHWLESSKSGEWILVIDNLDNLEIESKYIPIRQGAILFTTRDSRILGDPRFALPKNGRVDVEKMNFAEASSMCQTLGMTGNSDPRESTAQLELLELLDSLPLAIAQSAAYIRNTGMTTQRYTELFKESVNNRAKLLETPLSISQSSKENHNSRTVMTTWTITIDKIKVQNPLALEILQFMSVMNPGKISEQVIRAAPRFRAAGSLIFSESIGVLLSFALLGVVQPSYFRLHRLVSFWSRVTMGKSIRNEILHDAAKALQGSFPDDMMAHLSTCSELLPHATTLLQHVQESTTECAEGLMLHGSVATALYSMGEYNKALQLYQRALDGREKTLGKDHHSTLDTVHNMARVFQSQGGYDKALQWYQRALDGSEKTLGKDHPSTLGTVHNMASVFDDQGEHDKALQWYQRALDGREKTLGKDHPSTLNTVHNMASVFNSQRDYEKALQWYQRALDSYEKTLGKDHPSTLDTVNNMATVFRNQGDYDKALQWYQRALDGYEKTLGKDHPSTLRTITNIARFLDLQVPPRRWTRSVGLLRARLVKKKERAW